MYLLVKVELGTFDKKSIVKKGERNNLQAAEELRVKLNQKYIDSPFYFITLKRKPKQIAKQRANEYQGMPIGRAGQ